MKALIARRPEGSYLQHPVDVESLVTVIERLSLVVPRDATWTVEEVA